MREYRCCYEPYTLLLEHRGVRCHRVATLATVSCRAVEPCAVVCTMVELYGLKFVCVLCDPAASPLPRRLSAGAYRAMTDVCVSVLQDFGRLDIVEDLYI